MALAKEIGMKLWLHWLWLDGIYAPEGATQQQLDELDQLTEKWIDDHERGPRQT